MASIQEAAVFHCVHEMSLSITLRLSAAKPSYWGPGTRIQSPTQETMQGAEHSSATPFEMLLDDTTVCKEGMVTRRDSPR